MTFDVLGIGNSIVDILSFVDEDFLKENGIEKGVMTLIDENQAESLYKKVGQATEASGGSAANTVAGIASLGGNPAFIGRVLNDNLGKIFTHDLNATGVSFDSLPAQTGLPTARCFIFVTPDAERSMLTYLGACTQLDESYIDEELVRNSKAIYIEGYLWDGDRAIAALKHAIKTAKANGVKVAFSLSDPFCVSRHRDAFFELLADIDILFANEDEAKMLFAANDFHDAVNLARGQCEIIAITRSGEGSTIVTKDETINIEAAKIEKLVDTTGAGDLYAGGFLYGYTQGKSLKECGDLGSAAAGTIVQQLGARPQRPLSKTIAA